MMEYMDRPEDDAYRALLDAVVVQAAEDYREAWIRLLKNAQNNQAKRRLKETETFFLSPDFIVYTAVEGPRLLRMLEKEREEGEKVITAYLKTARVFLAQWKAFIQSGKKDRAGFSEAEKSLAEMVALREKFPEYAVNMVRSTKEVREAKEALEKIRRKRNDCEGVLVPAEGA